MKEKALDILQSAITVLGSNHFVKLVKFLKDTNQFDEVLSVSESAFGKLQPQEYFYLLLNEKESVPQCTKTNIALKFISLSVGYRFCGPARTCECANKSVGEKSKLSKQSFSAEKRLEIKSKREATNLEKYGVVNTFMDDTIKCKIRETNLERYGTVNPQQNSEIKKKTNETIMERYGVTNIASHQEIKDKIVETNLERYGVVNPLSSEIIRNKAKKTMVDLYGYEHPNQVKEIKLRRQSTNIEKYGVSEPINTRKAKEKAIETVRVKFINQFIEKAAYKAKPGFNIAEYISINTPMNWVCTYCNAIFISKLDNNRIPTCEICFPTTVSSGHQTILDKLDEWNIEYRVNDRTIIKPKELDIVVESHKLAIEYCGTYWHSEISGGKLKEYHWEKMIKAYDAGYQLLTIFDDELLDKPDRLFSRLASILKINNDRIYARKCRVGKIDSVLSKLFSEKYHMMGHTSASIHYGLFHDDELVSVMTFGSSRFDRSGWELLRYCSNKSVVGGANKLFKHFLAKHPTGSIVSYADRRWSNGQVYFDMGFTLTSKSNPGYWYLSSSGKRFHRMNFTKKILTAQGYDSNKTEWQIMQERGYDRIWDCGQLVFRFNR